MINLRKSVWFFVIVLFGCNNAKETRPLETSQSELQISEIKLAGLDGQPVNLDPDVLPALCDLLP